MMQTRAFSAVFLSCLVASAVADQSNPISKVIELMSELQAKIIADGEAQNKVYREYYEWCDDATTEKRQEIETLTGQLEELTAAIQKAASDTEAHAGKIEELSSAISTNSADLKAASLIRKKEHDDFKASEAELMDTIDALGRAIGILQKHTFLLQGGKGADQTALKELTQTFETLLDATALTVQDKAQLTALLQQQQKSKEAENQEDEDGELGAPAANVYEGHSGGIVEVMEDMVEKAETQLSEARKEEMNSNHNFELLEQSLKDQIKFDNEEHGEAKKAKAASEEAKATAEGDHAATTEDLAEAQKVLKDTQMECMAEAAAHEAAVKGRAEELKAIATAKKIIQEMTGGAVSQSYSFLQMKTESQLRSRADLAKMEAVNVVKRLAKAQHSAMLAQLASRIEAAIHSSQRSGDDPFAKVKGLIADMIEKLLKEAAEEASHKAFCDEEMAETKDNKNKLETAVTDLTVKIDKANAEIEKLTQEIATLQEELAELAKLQAEMDKMREEEHAAFLTATADLEQGLEGVRMALKVLRDYYAEKQDDEALLQKNGGDLGAFMQQPEPPSAHEKSSGSASGVIGILEVAESDFAKNLAEAKSAEDAAQEQYEKITQENKVATASKGQDVAYKTKEVASLKKFVSETSEDLEGKSQELEAVNEYWEKLKDECIAKPETYEERKRRRDAEIAGLKEALQILEGEAVLLQRSSFLRRIHTH